LLHGYSLAFSFKFGCSELDDKNWVVDFGGLKKLKTWLEEMFDHTLVVDNKDPKIIDLLQLQEQGLAKAVVLAGVGCEKFAEHAFDYADALVKDLTDGRCWCVSCECSEHGANSGIYEAS
jgi:6-pyruvoyltetrahydropterin/6-carboxytetrahydropterin synthase